MTAAPQPPEPGSAADPAQIDAWVADSTRSYLISLFAIVDHMPLDAVIEVLRSACLRGFGTWMEPPKSPPQSIRPGTHLVEIALFGVTGSGLTQIEAAQSWRLAARRLLTEKDAA